MQKNHEMKVSSSHRQSTKWIANGHSPGGCDVERVAKSVKDVQFIQHDKDNVVPIWSILDNSNYKTSSDKKRLQFITIIKNVCQLAAPPATVADMQQYIRCARHLFLRSISVIYLQAFVTLYVQNYGLFGENGVLPVKNTLIDESPKVYDKLNLKPTLLWFSSEIGLNAEYMFDVICLFGIFLAFLGFLTQKVCNKFLFFSLWISYLSLYHVGQIFLSDLADELLLEVGLLCILIAPIRFQKFRIPSKKCNLSLQTLLPHYSILFWLVRWLLFRVAFSAGVAKMSSKSSIWYDLTASSKYFESIPLPNAISWYAHYCPLWFLKSVTVFAEINDLFVPLMFLVPIRSVKKLAFYIQVFMQVGILAVWLNRQILNSEFIAPMERNNQVLLDTLTFHEILLSNRTPLPVNPVFKHILDQIRSILLSVDPRILIFGLLLAGFVLIFQTLISENAKISKILLGYGFAGSSVKLYWSILLKILVD
eukprot:XP_008184894.2 PREDICTED: lipase maturation factor 2-like [Acyrthosiphon pisum]